MSTPEGGPASASQAFRRRRQLLRFLPPALLILLPTFLVLSGMGSTGALWGSDMITGSFQIRGLVGRLLREGRFPVWDPHTMCGFPFLAAMQSGVLYPLTWPVAFMDVGPFWTLTVVVHLGLAGLFAFQWLKKGLGVGRAAALAGACVFMLAGYILSRVLGGHISQICSYPWIAAVLWRTERLLQQTTFRNGVLLATSAALLFLPGFPQFPFLLALILVVRIAAFQIRAGRAGLKTTLAAAGAGLAGALLCAPQLFATLEMLPEVQRVTGISFKFAAMFSVPLPNLVCLLVPGFFGDDVGLPYWGRAAIWEAMGFVGIGALLLAALSWGGRHPQRWYWTAAAALAVLVALGSETPFFRLFYEAVPGARIFRGPGRYFSAFTVALAALSALGLDRLWKNPPEARKAARIAAIGAAALAVLILAGTAIWSRADPAPWNRFVAAQFADPECLAAEAIRRDADFPLQAKGYAQTGLVRAGVTLALLAACLFACSRGRRPAKIGASVFGTVLVAELLIFGVGFFRPCDPREYSWPQEFTDFVRHASGAPFRLASPGRKNMRQIGKCQLAGIDHVAGYESMMLRRFCELMNVIHGRPPDTLRLVGAVDVTHPVLDMLGVRLWLLEDGLPVPPGWRAVGKVSELTGDSVVLEAPR
ncbi:MAG TPA: hypothetical protein VE981_24755, partial [Planctomycetota bacterium]|nr:hypothetical protein [Planctomycetota bacterium]